MSDDRNDYQSLYNEKPYAVVSEDKITSMTTALEPCPDCGSRHHTNCASSAVSEEEQVGHMCQGGIWRKYPQGVCSLCPSDAATQPQPAGTREQISDARDDADRQYGELQWKQKEIDDLNQKFAALQQSHDVCVGALKSLLSIVPCLDIDSVHAAAMENSFAALANAEKLRAVK